MSSSPWKRIRQIFGGARAILHIHNAPLHVQPFAILTAVAAAAAVVDIRHRKAATGPELNLQIKRAGSRRGRPAVALDDQRRQLVGGGGEASIVRGIVPEEGGLAAGGGKFNQ